MRPSMTWVKIITSYKIFECVIYYDMSSGISVATLLLIIFRFTHPCQVSSAYSQLGHQFSNGHQGDVPTLLLMHAHAWSLLLKRTLSYTRKHKKSTADWFPLCSEFMWTSNNPYWQMNSGFGPHDVNTSCRWVSPCRTVNGGRRRKTPTAFSWIRNPDWQSTRLCHATEPVTSVSHILWRSRVVLVRSGSVHVWIYLKVPSKW